MAVRKIPAREETICDACGKDASHSRVNGKLVLHQNACDWSGCAVADGTRKWDLCDDCTYKLGVAVEKTIETIKGKK